MKYYVCKKENVWEYDGKGHFTCICHRFHTAAKELEGSKLTMSYTEFLPEGGAEYREAALEMIYCVAKGELVIICGESEDGPKTEYKLAAGESVHMMPGTWRGIRNESGANADLAVIIMAN